MVGLESSMDLANAAKKMKNPEVAEAERERQNRFLTQLRARKPVNVKAAKPVKTKAKSGLKKGKRMARARKGETYYCTVCGCEVMCTTSSKSPVVCCDEVMFVL